jgi:hypothetical protein
MIKKMPAQKSLRKYFHQYTRLSPVWRDLTEDEKRLQDEIGCKDLKLRYNCKLGFCQVWHDSPDVGLYIIFNIKDKYNLCWAIWEMKRRQKSQRELRDLLLKTTEENEEEFRYNNEQLSRETAELLYDHRVGKVTTST